MKVKEVIKEDNKYQKSMKWHLIVTSDFGKTSQWFKTRKEAEALGNVWINSNYDDKYKRATN